MHRHLAAGAVGIETVVNAAAPHAASGEEHTAVSVSSLLWRYTAGVLVVGIAISSQRRKMFRAGGKPLDELLEVGDQVQRLCAGEVWGEVSEPDVMAKSRGAQPQGGSRGDVVDSDHGGCSSGKTNHSSVDRHVMSIRPDARLRGLS